jgi:hypothetical protein
VPVTITARTMPEPCLNTVAPSANCSLDNVVVHAGRSEMPTKSRRSKRKRTRTVNMTVAVSPEDLELFEKCATKSFEARATWAYRRLKRIALEELGLDPGPKRP